MAPRRLRLVRTWGLHPVFDTDVGVDVDPATLGLPKSLVERLEAWAARWDTTFDVDHPERPKVEHFVIEELGRDGARLWRALLGQLSPQAWTIEYVHDDVVYRALDDLPPDWRVG